MFCPPHNETAVVFISAGRGHLFQKAGREAGIIYGWGLGREGGWLAGYSRKNTSGNYRGLDKINYPLQKTSLNVGKLLKLKLY